MRCCGMQCNAMLNGGVMCCGDLWLIFTDGVLLCYVDGR